MVAGDKGGVPLFALSRGKGVQHALGGSVEDALAGHGKHEVVGGKEVAGDGHLGRAGSGVFAGVGIKERSGFRDVLIGVAIQMTQGWSPDSMDGRVGDPNHEGVVRFGTGFDPIERALGDDVRDVAGGGFCAGLGFEVAVVVTASLDGVVIEAVGFAVNMPFPNHGSVVSVGLKGLGEGREFIPKTSTIARLTIGVRVETGEQCGARGTANGVANEALVEAHPVRCQSIDVGGSIDFGTVGADRVLGVVVCEDNHDVGAIRGQGQGR